MINGFIIEGTTDGTGTAIFSPVPVRTPVLDKSGLMSQVWIRWLKDIEALKGVVTSAGEAGIGNIECGSADSTYLITQELDAGAADTIYLPSQIYDLGGA